MKKYEELGAAHKALARKLHPEDYEKWFYKIIGVEIEFSAK